MLNNNLLFVNLLEKKFFNKNIYHKYFIRYSYQKPFDLNNSFKIIDNNSSFQTINLKYFQKNYFKKKNFFLIGSSILLDSFVYKKNRFQFKFYLLNSKKFSLNYINIFYNKLRCLQSSKKALVLVKPQRGGLSCYFNGVIGFFPFKHFFRLLNLNLQTRLSRFNLKNFFLFKNNYNFILKQKNQKIYKNLLFLLKTNVFLKSFFVSIKKNSFNLIKNKTIKLSLYKFFYIQILSNRFNSNFFSFFFNIIYKKFNLYYKKRVLLQNFSKLSFLLFKQGRVLPKILQNFIFYKLKFKIKNNYYNGLMKKKIKFRKKKKRFFKQRLKLIFLAFSQTNNILSYKP